MDRPKVSGRTVYSLIIKSARVTKSELQLKITVISSLSNKQHTHGLRTPNEVFFHRNPKLLGLGRQFGQINFGVFLADLSAPILVL